mmetsp:Transcript_26742/g.48188  ORF Transcript_26742/g.48188 Transcript_26742/m.48188 type:complete len:104 (-) Transcript_26742:1923-2234(-)
MLTAGFKFMCCAVEEDADDIVWHTNLLSFEHIQAHQLKLKGKENRTFVQSFSKPNAGNHRRTQSADYRYKPKQKKKRSVVSSVALLKRKFEVDLSLYTSMHNS